MANKNNDIRRVLGHSLQKKQNNNDNNQNNQPEDSGLNIFNTNNNNTNANNNNNNGSSNAPLEAPELSNRQNLIRLIILIITILVCIYLGISKYLPNYADKLNFNKTKTEKPANEAPAPKAEEKKPEEKKVEEAKPQEVPAETAKKAEPKPQTAPSATAAKKVDLNSITGYKSINKTAVTKGLTPIQCIRRMNSADRDLKEYLEEEHSAAEKEKVFSIFYKNFADYANTFVDTLLDNPNATVEESLTASGIKLDPQEKQSPLGTYRKIISPQTYLLMYIKNPTTGREGFSENNDYLRKSYGKYLNKDWEDFFYASNNDYITAFTQNYSYKTLCSVRFNFWGNFIKKHPNFIMNSYLEDMRKAFAKDGGIGYAPAR